MGRNSEMERQFSFNLDRVLAGEAVIFDPESENDSRADLEFAREMIQHRINPSPAFEARLQKQLFSRLDIVQAKPRRDLFRNSIIKAILRPAWGTLLPIALALVLIYSILGTSGLLPFDQSPSVEAASIAENSPRTQALFKDEKIDQTQVLMILDNQGTILMQSKTKGVATTVDLNTRQVTEVVQVTVPEFSLDDLQLVEQVVKADPQTRNLMDQGASIIKVSAGKSPDIRYVPGADGKLHPQVQIKLIGEAYLKLKGENWVALVDLDSQQLLNVHLARNTGFVRSTEIFADKAVPAIAVICIVLLLGLLRKHRWAILPADVFSVILGLLGLAAGLYTHQYTPLKLVPVLLIPVIGSVSGVIGFRHSRKWLAASGIAFCALAIAFEIFQLIIAWVR